MRRSNPFFNRNSIVHPRYFYNRTDKVAKVLDLLYQGVCVMVSGPRRIGRSSFLRYMSDPGVQAVFGFPEATQRLFLYMDCALCHLQPAQVFYGMLLDRLRDTAEPSPESLRAALLKRIRDIHKQVGPLVIVLDEFDSVYQNPHMTAADFEWLRGLNTEGLVAYCCALTSRETTLVDRQLAMGAMAFSNSSIHQSIGLFSRWDARQMLINQMESVGDAFAPPLLDYLVDDLAGPHPYLLQLAAYEAYELGDSLMLDQSTLSHEALQELRYRYMNQARYYWESLWETLSAVDQKDLALLSLAQIQPSRESAARLERAGLIQMHTELGWQPIARLFADFVRGQPIPHLVQLRCLAIEGETAQPYLLIDQESGRAFLDGVRMPLPPLPFQLLLCLAQRPNQMVKLQEIEQRLWPDDRYYDGAEERIRPHVRVVRDALGNATYVQNRRGQGYSLMAE